MTLRTLEKMGRRKSEQRKMRGVIRIDADVLELVRKAAPLVGSANAAEYASAILERVARADILRESKKIVDSANSRGESN